MSMHPIENGWEIIPDSVEVIHALSYLDSEFKDDFPLIYKEQKLILDMLKLFITGEYGYYFSETHEHERPEELDNLEWKRVYNTPLPFYYKAGEYNSIDVAYTKEYTYYAISLHGCDFASALTEYVRVRFKKYPDQVDPADEDHIYFNADPEESENGVTGPAEYYDEHGL